MDDERFEASRVVPFAGIGPVAAGLVLGAMVIARAGGTPWLAAVADDTPACPVDGNVELPKRPHEKRILFSWRLRTRMDGRRPPDGESKVSR